MRNGDDTYLVVDNLGVFEDHRVAQIDVLVLDEEFVVYIAADLFVRLHDLLDADILRL